MTDRFECFALLSFVFKGDEADDGYGNGKKGADDGKEDTDDGEEDAEDNDSEENYKDGCQPEPLGQSTLSGYRHGSVSLDLPSTSGFPSHSPSSPYPSPLYPFPPSVPPPPVSPPHVSPSSFC